MKYNGTNLREVLEAHYKWYNEEEGITEEDRADFSNTSLKGLCLVGVCLYGANLQGVDLTGTCLAYADLQMADLTDAILERTDLYGAKLSGAKIKYVPFACPDTGSFIAYKKAYLYDPKIGEIGDTIIIKLRIPEDAQRLSDMTNACWSSKAECLEIQSLDGKVLDNTYAVSMFDRKTLYIVGETTFANGFSTNRFSQYHGKGIYWFLDRQNAVYYMDFRKVQQEFEEEYSELAKKFKQKQTEE